MLPEMNNKDVDIKAVAAKTLGICFSAGLAECAFMAPILPLPIVKDGKSRSRRLSNWARSSGRRAGKVRTSSRAPEIAHTSAIRRTKGEMLAFRTFPL